MYKKALLVFLLAFFVMSCGDDEQENSESSLSREQFAFQWPKEYCGWMFRCCSSEERETGVTTEGDCVVKYKSVIVKSLQNWKDSLWDGVKASKYIKRLNSSECPKTDYLSDIMGLMKVKKNGLGEQCYMNSYCVSQNCIGTVCAKQGTAVGDPCEPLEQLWGAMPCTSSLFCSYSSQTCKSKMADGNSCAFDYECASGLCASTASKCVTTSGYSCDGK